MRRCDCRYANCHMPSNSRWLSMPLPSLRCFVLVVSSKAAVAVVVVVGVVVVVVAIVVVAVASIGGGLLNSSIKLS
jgi:hypothetical protein